MRTAWYDDGEGVDDLDNDTPIVIYPNPSTGFLNINIPNSHNKSNSIRIYDYIGKLKYTLNTFDSILKLDISDLYNGFYYIKINENFYPLMIQR